MSKLIINPPSLAKPSGFNHGILTDPGRLLFLAGQPGVDSTGKIQSPDDLVAQFAQALSNLQAVIHQAGGVLSDIVKMTIYVRDRDDYRSKLSALNASWKTYFGRYYPAVTLVEVSDLFDEGALVELDCIAVIQSVD